MTAFKPPQTFLDHLGEPIHARQYRIKPQFSREEFSTIKKHITADTTKHYLTSPNGAYQYIGLLVGEVLKNARWHGDQKDLPIHFAVFAGEHTYSLASHDGGPYFYKPEIKKLWEAKEPIPQAQTPYSHIGANAGMNLLYMLAQKIHVDTDHGVLHALIAPRDEPINKKQVALRKEVIDDFLAPQEQDLFTTRHAVYANGD